jgi:hypothetical protein
LKSFFLTSSVYQLFFYENEEQRDARDYQEQQRFFRAEQERQRQREGHQRNRNVVEENVPPQEEVEELNSVVGGGQVPKRGFFGTVYFLVYLFFISLYPSYEFVPSNRRVEHEHQE